MRREEEWREEPEEICRLAFLSEKILHGRRLADYFDQVYERHFTAIIVMMFDTFRHSVRN